MSNLKHSEKEIKLKMNYGCAVCGKEITRHFHVNERMNLGNLRCECGYKVLYFKVVLNHD